MRCLIVVPARMASTRFPGKPLCDLGGKPMVQWVVEACRRADVAEDVVVATPDDAILEACAEFGARAIRTRADHPSGTDRLVEVTSEMPAELYVNVQGDEPLVRPESIRLLASEMLARPEAPVGTLFDDCPEVEIENPAVVKLVRRESGEALYFSRYPIPYPRSPRVSIYKHVGMYAYRLPALKAFASSGPTVLETTESLEQLRFLELGFPILTFKGEGSELAVDTPEQADEVRRILQSRS